MLDTNMKTQLKAYLEKLTKPVELIATLDDSAKSAEIKELLTEIAELSEKVTFKEDNTPDTWSIMNTKMLDIKNTCLFCHHNLTIY